ncbi:MAG: ferritin [Desulfobacterales bacterium]|nr:ferritin [Desulfobacterales bacterium]MBF0395308.1 ferritin [Desulfobacterales bacterium]
MLNEKVCEELNNQLNAELYSSYLYLSMSAFFKFINLGGFSSWIYVHAQEELLHAMKYYDFIKQRGGRVVLKEIKAPPKDWESPTLAFENVLEHELSVTKMINELVSITIKERDAASNVFIQWFVTEQAEEESKAKDVLGKLKLIGNAQGGLFMLDRELSLRKFASSK